MPLATKERKPLDIASLTLAAAAKAAALRTAITCLLALEGRRVCLGKDVVAWLVVNLCSA